MTTSLRHFLSTSFLIIAICIHPLSARAAQTDYDGGAGFGRDISDWRRDTTDIQNKIDDMDSDRVENLTIPVLFGVTLKNLTKNFGDPRIGHAHEGLDIMAPEGTPIVSPTDAVVMQTGIWTGAGNFVTTAAPGGESFTYMHLSKIADIERGDVLEAGDIIGYVGHTGNAIATAPHLHFEIRDEDSTALDPYPRITETLNIKDKIEYLDTILDDVNDSDELAEFLVIKFRSDFLAAQAQGTTLPNDIKTALAKIVAPVTTTVSGSSTGTLKVGSRGPEVVTLQKFLIKKGIGTASRVTADGAFGPITRQALINYQASVGLTADGVYGPKSRAYISAQLNN